MSSDSVSLRTANQCRSAGYSMMDLTRELREVTIWQPSGCVTRVPRKLVKPLGAVFGFSANLCRNPLVSCEMRASPSAVAVVMA